MIWTCQLVLLFSYFFKVHAHNVRFNKSTTIDNNNNLGTTERVRLSSFDYGLIKKVDGGHVIYSCDTTKKFSKYEIPIELLVDELSNITKAVTIKDCNSKVQFGRESDAPGNPKLNVKNININQLKIKNVNECLLGPLLGGLQSLMNGSISIYIEDVKRIEIFPSKVISSVPYSDEKPQKKMESLFFSLKNVTIGKIEEDAISWEESQIIFNMTWDKVTVEDIRSFAIKCYKFAKNELVNNQISIINSTFTTLPSNAINFVGSNFHFLNNKVDAINSAAINITTMDVKICNNEFNYIKNFSFSSISRGPGAILNFSSNKINSSEQTAIYFGLYDATNIKEQDAIFRFNQFKCVNSEWIRYPKSKENTTLKISGSISANYGDMLIYENIFYNNTDNICSDEEIKCSESDEEYPVLSIKKFQDRYKLFKDDWAKYCTNYTTGNFITYSIIIIICAITIIAVIYLAVTTRGQFLCNKS